MLSIRISIYLGPIITKSAFVFALRLTEILLDYLPASLKDAYLIAISIGKYSDFV